MDQATILDFSPQPLLPHGRFRLCWKVQQSAAEGLCFLRRPCGQAGAPGEVLGEAATSERSLGGDPRRGWEWDWAVGRGAGWCAGWCVGAGELRGELVTGTVSFQLVEPKRSRRRSDRVTRTSDKRTRWVNGERQWLIGGFSVAWGREPKPCTLCALLGFR